MDVCRFQEIEIPGISNALCMNILQELMDVLPKVAQLAKNQCGWCSSPSTLEQLSRREGLRIVVYLADTTPMLEMWHLVVTSFSSRFGLPGVYLVLLPLMLVANRVINDIRDDV